MFAHVEAAGDQQLIACEVERWFCSLVVEAQQQSSKTTWTVEGRTLSADAW